MPGKHRLRKPRPFPEYTTRKSVLGIGLIALIMGALFPIAAVSGNPESTLPMRVPGPPLALPATSAPPLVRLLPDSIPRAATVEVDVPGPRVMPVAKAQVIYPKGQVPAKEMAAAQLAKRKAEKAKSKHAAKKNEPKHAKKKEADRPRPRHAKPDDKDQRRKDFVKKLVKKLVEAAKKREQAQSDS